MQQPLNTYHLTNLPSFSAYVLPVNRLQLFRCCSRKSLPQMSCIFKAEDCCIAAIADRHTHTHTHHHLFSSVQLWKKVLMFILQLPLRTFVDSKSQICLILTFAEQTVAAQKYMGKKHKIWLTTDIQCSVLETTLCKMTSLRTVFTITSYLCPASWALQCSASPNPVASSSGHHQPPCLPWCPPLGLKPQQCYCRAPTSKLSTTQQGACCSAVPAAVFLRFTSPVSDWCCRKHTGGVCFTQIWPSRNETPEQLV